MKNAMPTTKDMFGRSIELGDAVAFNPGPAYDSTGLEAGRVTGIHKKMISVSWSNGQALLARTVRPSKCLLISMDDYLMHALSKS
jgi:hypothetical protein